MAKDRRIPAELRRNREYVKWSPELGRRICERLAAGELLTPLCRQPGMPSTTIVAKWAAAKPAFRAELNWARRVGGRSAHKRWSAEVACEEVGQAVFERLCDGESLTRITADPLMPSMTTIINWRQRFPDFEALVQLGMRVRAERMADESWEMALEATPQTAFVTDVRLKHLRWLAGAMAPRQFRTKMVEPEAARETLTTLIRTFVSEEDPVTGKLKVVALCPNPVTGQMEREDVPGWGPTPADAVLIPAGSKT